MRVLFHWQILLSVVEKNIKIQHLHNYQQINQNLQLRVPPQVGSESKSFYTESGRVDEVGRSVDNLAKKKFFREMLAKHFPDWEARLSVEKEQAISYNKAAKKLKEFQKFSPLLKNHEKWLTDEEKFSIDYFHGRGIYKKH